MAQGEPLGPEQFEWADPPLRERLFREPAVVLKEQGVTVPDGLPPHVLYDVVRITSLLWREGKVERRDRFHIDPSDEGLLFGRGVWESTRTINGVPWLWPWHIERLRRTAALLSLDLAPERLPDSVQVSEFVRSLTSMDVVVRLNVSAGGPSRPGVVWMTAALPPRPPTAVRLRSCRYPFPKGHPYLVWKTFQYATRLLIGQEATRAGFDTALLLDAEDHLLEAAHANLFVRLPDGWATPASDGGLLPGTLRRYLLEQSPLPVRERTIPLALLPQVTEAFLTNSNVGITPVTQIDQRAFAIGPETIRLQQWLQPGGAG